MQLRTKVKKDPAADVAFATVAVREKDGAWEKCGFVAAEKGYTAEQSAARQKRLIGEHAVRLYPRLQAESAQLEFGLRRVERFVDNEPEEDGEGDFMIMGKCDSDKVSEKKIGFEGIADAATGYYCLYDGGKVKAGGGSGGSDSEMGITGGKKSGEKRTGL